MRGIRIILLLSLLLSACSGRKDAGDAMPTCLEELVGHTVAVAGGSSTDLLLSQYEGIDLMRISIGDMPLAVKSGRAEFAMMQEIQYDANQLDGQGFRKCFSGILKGLSAVAFRKDDDVDALGRGTAVVDVAGGDPLRGQPASVLDITEHVLIPETSLRPYQDVFRIDRMRQRSNHLIVKII